MITVFEHFISQLGKVCSVSLLSRHFQLQFHEKKVMRDTI